MLRVFMGICKVLFVLENILLVFEFEGEGKLFSCWAGPCRGREVDSSWLRIFISPSFKATTVTNLVGSLKTTWYITPNNSALWPAYMTTPEPRSGLLVCIHLMAALVASSFR